MQSICDKATNIFENEMKGGYIYMGYSGSLITQIFLLTGVLGSATASLASVLVPVAGFLLLAPLLSHLISKNGPSNEASLQMTRGLCGWFIVCSIFPALCLLAVSPGYAAMAMAISPVLFGLSALELSNWIDQRSQGNKEMKVHAHFKVGLCQIFIGVLCAGFGMLIPPAWGLAVAVVVPLLASIFVAWATTRGSEQQADTNNEGTGSSHSNPVRLDCGIQ